MNLVLVKPNTKKKQYGALKDISAVEPPIWHVILANYYETDIIIDAEAEDYSLEETIERIKSHNPDRVVILATGSHPSAFIQQRQDMEIMKSLLEGIQVECIDALPISPVQLESPKWDLLPMDKYRAHNWHSWSNDCEAQPYGVLYTSISCPFKCEFCTIHQFYGKNYEQRLLKDIFADIDELARLGIKNIKMMDELFIFNTKRAIEICDYIIEKGYDFNIWAYARIDIMNSPLLKKLKQAGINWLAFGIETGNDNIRLNVLKGKFDNKKIKEVIKMTKDAGINVLGNYMLGFWEDSKETLQDTLDLALELQCEYSNIYCVVAYPDSALYDKMEKEGVDLPKTWDEYAQYSQNFKPLPTKYLSGKEVLKFRDNAFNVVFNDEKYLAMMKEKFGQKVIDDITKMTSCSLKRKEDV